MSEQPEFTVKLAVAKTLIRSIHQYWLHGFNNSWRAWLKLQPTLRASVESLTEFWLNVLANEALPKELELQTLHVQLFNIARQRGRNPRQFIRNLADTDPPRTPEGSFVGPYGDHPKRGPQLAWRDLSVGFVAPHWKLIVKVWEHLTTDHRRMLCLALGDDVPRRMTAPADFAWMDRVASRTGPSDEQLLRAYRDLDPSVANNLASVLINQHKAWTKAGLIPISGCIDKVDDYAPNALAQLATFHKPFQRRRLNQIRTIGITYPPGIFREPPLRTDAAGDPKTTDGFFDEGVTLVRAKSTRAHSKPAAIAGRGRLVKVESSDTPLLLILDIDLKRKEMRFLRLKGSRLRICDWPDYNGELCFTHVGLDGSVKLYSSKGAEEKLAKFQPRGEAYFPGRALISPWEGMRESGYGGTAHRIGGAACWEQYPEAPVSPESGKSMTFIAQFPHPLGGTAYVFLDYENLIAAVVKQID